MKNSALIAILLLSCFWLSVSAQSQIYYSDGSYYLEDDLGQTLIGDNALRLESIMRTEPEASLVYDKFLRRRKAAVGTATVSGISTFVMGLGMVFTFQEPYNPDYSQGYQLKGTDNFNDEKTGKELIRAGGVIGAASLVTSVVLLINAKAQLNKSIEVFNRRNALDPNMRPLLTFYGNGLSMRMVLEF